MDVLSHNYAEQDKQLLREQLERCGAFTTLSRRSENSDLPEITLESLHQDAIESIAAAVAAHTAPVPRLAFLETAYGLLAASFDASGDRMQKLLNDEAPELSTYQDVATTALFIAAHKGHDKVISSLIDFGLDADSTDLHGSTCLHIAAKENHLRCVQLLLSNGANVEHRRVDNGRTPWMDICGSPAHEAVARILAAHSAIKDDFESGGGHVLYGAAAGGQVEQVRTMLERGMDPSFKTAYLWCPLVSRVLA